MELTELHEEMRETTALLRTFVAQQEKYAKEHGHRSALLEEGIEKAGARLDELEARITRLPPVVEGGERPRDAASRAFGEWLRFGSVSTEHKGLLRHTAFSPAELKVMTVTNDTAGGVLAPDEYVRELIRAVSEFSPLRTIARVRATANRAVQIPKRTGQFSAAWVSETGTRSERSGLTYALEEIPTHEMYALVDISQQDLEDAAFDLEAELQQEFAEQFAVLEGAAFVNGTAVGQPEGFLKNAGVTGSYYTAQGEASTLTDADAVVGLVLDLKEAYQRNATFVLNRATLKALRQLKDTTEQYIWQPGMGEVPATLDGRPYVLATDMDGVGTNKFPIAVADWQRGYVIVDRVEMSLLRDPYTQATSGTVRFIARKRVGGQVVLPEAIRLLKIAST